MTEVRWVAEDREGSVLCVMIREVTWQDQAPCAVTCPTIVLHIGDKGVGVIEDTGAITLQGDLCANSIYIIYTHDPPLVYT